MIFQTLSRIQLMLGVIWMVGMVSGQQYTFGDRDEFEIKGRMCPELTQSYHITLKSSNEFYIIYLNRPKSDIESSMEINVLNTSLETPLIQSDDGGGIQHLIVKPQQIYSCRNSTDHCNVSIHLNVPSPPSSDTECVSKSFKLTIVRGVTLQFNERVESTVSKMKVKRFGIDISPKSLNALISVVPDQSSKDVDVDLFVYHESDLFSFIFPNSDVENRNHHWNTPEHALIQSADEREGFFVVYVYGSPESSQSDSNSFEIIVFPNYSIMSLYISLLGSLLGLLISMVCLASAIVIFVKGRQEYMIWEGPGRTSSLRIGATDKELETIPLMSFQDIRTQVSEDDARCVICLENYDDTDTLRKINCGHHFHRSCVDSWLQISKCCPLCKQIIDSAIDMRRSSELNV